MPSLTHAPVGMIQRKCACGNSSATGQCAECNKKETTLQRRSAGQHEPDRVPPIVYDVLRSPGQRLDAETRAFFEPRLGHDFSSVRVHTDAKAAESAQAVNALAYTVGQDLVFGAGQYQPHAFAGRRLLSHELTHAIQQQGQSFIPRQLHVRPADDAYEREADQASANLTPGESDTVLREPNAVSVSLQRTCGPTAIGKPSGCASLEGDVIGEHYLFQVNCDDFKPGQEASLRAFAGTLSGAGSMKIHGFASEEGDPTYNVYLSCARAVKGKTVIDDVLGGSSMFIRYELYAHGATAGNRVDRRSITIDWLPEVSRPIVYPPKRTPIIHPRQSVPPRPTLVEAIKQCLEDANLPQLIASVAIIAACAQPFVDSPPLIPAFLMADAALFLACLSRVPALGKVFRNIGQAAELLGCILLRLFGPIFHWAGHQLHRATRWAAHHAYEGGRWAVHHLSEAGRWILGL